MGLISYVDSDSPPDIGLDENIGGDTAAINNPRPTEYNNTILPRRQFCVVRTAQ